MTIVLERPSTTNTQHRERASRPPIADSPRSGTLRTRASLRVRRLPWGVAFGPDRFGRPAERREIRQTLDLAP